MKFVLDASALISGLAPNKNCYTVMEIVNEIRDVNAKTRVELSLSDGTLKVIEPRKAYCDAVRKEANASGDIQNLSENDIKLVALAMQLKEKQDIVILTDDYSIQNIAQRLGLKFKSTTEGEIKNVFTWKRICRGCGREFKVEYTGKCDICGTDTRKVAKKEFIL